ncbi:hypothetical protein [Pseudobacteriovorax antillogorgiicola]|uniref:Lipoprotein n=1 Tax=Pseudobacteriovorax antillogorgiicola TaxID=1513793 RepID=A0A1Y6CS92_9BACT|nr:hypothetical protein [Pseudobacteriovorax antillogorgiicola]TCS40582.1 hypothetical protein EDD56_1561 [Pseudobacteriovorax antillogorgiicola]SMF84598.1 hypothetical protein SAMN06296036_1581 [Pseudobacteriovorax antillogorgiicola]
MKATVFLPIVFLISCSSGNESSDLSSRYKPLYNTCELRGDQLHCGVQEGVLNTRDFDPEETATSLHFAIYGDSTLNASEQSFHYINAYLFHSSKFIVENVEGNNIGGYSDPHTLIVGPQSLVDHLGERGRSADVYDPEEEETSSVEPVAEESGSEGEELPTNDETRDRA